MLPKTFGSEKSTVKIFKIILLTLFYPLKDKSISADKKFSEINQ